MPESIERDVSPELRKNQSSNYFGITAKSSCLYDERISNNSPMSSGQFEQYQRQSTFTTLQTDYDNEIVGGMPWYVLKIILPYQ